MPYRILYHADVKAVDLPAIDAKIKAIIKRAIDERLGTQPEMYGKPLSRTLKGYWKLRVGDYRIVFKVIEDQVLILGIIHRKDVYEKVQRRT
jgi:mRNA interferase RelE/StbE